jgi:hypothetical protein
MGSASMRTGRTGVPAWRLRLLTSRVGQAVLPGAVLLRYTSRAGATVTVPVQAARAAGRLVVLAGHADTKRWWRHFREAATVQVWCGGGWHRGTGHVAGATGEAADLLRARFPRVRLSAAAVLVEVTVDDLPASASASALADVPRGGRLFRRWFAAVTMGEFLGFSVPAVAGALTAGAPAGIAVASILAAGAVEGALLGSAQALVLTRALPGLSGRRWVAATAAAAVVAYAIGMLPSLLAGAVAGMPPVLLVAAAVVLGAALLASIGTAQWLVLRAVVPGCARWITTTALAWTAGLGVFLGFATPLWQPGQSVPVTIAIGAAGGLLMAAVTAAITGDALRRLLDTDRQRQPIRPHTGGCQHHDG